MAKKLTDKAIQKAKPRKNDNGEAVRTEIPDAGKPGLYLVVQPNGRKSWAVRYRRLSDGAPRKYTLDGGFVSLRMARKLAQDALDSVADGGDPAAEKRARKKALDNDEGRDLFEAVAKDFIRRYAMPKNRSWAETARLIGLRPDPENDGEFVVMEGGLVRKWGKRRIHDVTRRDIIEYLDSITDRGAGVLANRTFAALRKLFNWCCTRDILVASPCAGLKPPAPEVSRDRVLSDDELRWIWKACEASRWPFGGLFQMLLVTGQRRDEVGEITASEIDAVNRLWTIPASRAKNGIAHDVPLPALALEILEALPRVASDAGYIFTTNGETAVSGYSRAKARIDAEMLRIARREAQGRGEDPNAVEIERWTLHDLRRSVATGMARLGVDLQVIEKVLNHISGSFAGIVGTYQRFNYADPKRKALDAWARFVSLVTDPYLSAAHDAHLSTGDEEARDNAHAAFLRAINEGGARWARYVKTLTDTPAANVVELREAAQ